MTSSSDVIRVGHTLCGRYAIAVPQPHERSKCDTVCGILHVVFPCHYTESPVQRFDPVTHRCAHYDVSAIWYPFGNMYSSRLNCISNIAMKNICCRLLTTWFRHVKLPRTQLYSYHLVDSFSTLDVMLIDT